MKANVAIRNDDDDDCGDDDDDDNDEMFCWNFISNTLVSLDFFVTKMSGSNAKILQGCNIAKPRASNHLIAVTKVERLALS